MILRILLGVSRWVQRIQSRGQARKAAAHAGKVLSRAWGRPVSLVIVQTFYGATLRCAVRGGGPETPATVIVKRVKPKGRQRYDPADAGPQSMACRLFNDWAGIELLTRLGVPTPALLVADRERGFLVLADFGDRGFDELLSAGDPALARAAALDYARALGRLHAASRGRQEDYDALRDRLGPRTTAREEFWGTREWFDRTFAELRESFAHLGLSLPSAAESELARLAAAISNPGPFLAYTHGDPCPDNLRLSATEAQLIDFEHGGFRHALIDAAFIRMALPTCWRVNRFPDDLVAEMAESYRRELAAGCPEATDDARFGAALLDACGFWLVATLSFALKKPAGPQDQDTALERDQEWGISTLRQIVLARLQAFISLAESLAAYPALVVQMRHLRDRLGELWGAVPELPVFPVFRGSGC